MSRNSESIHLSVVIPAYNEAGRLDSTLEQVIAYLNEQPYAAEVLVVDDGSSDSTAELAGKVLEGRVAHRVLVNEGNRGKGYSVRRGMLAARGEHRLFSDADLSTPIEHAGDLLAALEGGAAAAQTPGGADIAIGSRVLEGSDIEVHQSFIRESAGKMFSVVQRALLGTGIKDTQCGFKMFTREAAEAVFPHQTLDRWAFDAELLFVAQRLGLEIAEVAVRWVDSPETKVSMVSDGLKMVLDLAKIRWRHRRVRPEQA